MAQIIPQSRRASGHDFLCYNICMGRNVADLLEQALDGVHLEMLRLLALQASFLGMPMYLVGGVVRDILLGRVVHDFDLVVEGDSADLADQILKEYGGRTLTHAKFGTATWVLNDTTLKRLNFPSFQVPAQSLSFDLVSARTETYERPGALPTVTFSNIRDDLRRRDFTINAMALRLDGARFGQLVDPLNGEVDLGAGIVRVLHDRSFLDDPTRIFRAIRYAARYNFRLAPDTRALINAEALTVLTQLSGERLRHEFDLIFEEPNAPAMLETLKELGVLAALHPALPTADPRTLSVATEPPAEAFGEFPVPELLSFRQTLGWTLFLLPLAPSEIDALAKRLAFPTLLAKAVQAAAALRRDLASTPERKPSQWAFLLDTFSAIAVYAVHQVTAHSALRAYLTQWRTVRPYTTGYTLQKRGLEPGPRFKEILTRLRAAWLDGEVATEAEEVKLLEQLI
jgi:tRNA nucleotidyltransferase (CCA-adding enzyme)